MTSQLMSIGELVQQGAILKIEDGNHGEIHPKSKDYVVEGIPFVMANDIKGNRVDLDCCQRISEALAQSLRKGFAKAGDVLLTHKGTLGRTAVVGDVDPYIMLTPQVTYYRVAPEILNNFYLLYAFQDYEFQASLASIGQQATRSYIGITAQRGLKIRYRPIDEQLAIVRQIRPYDDLIENNRRRIQLLEESARLLYREWFVHLRFPGHEHFKVVDGIPEGWSSLRVEDIGRLVFGHPFKSEWFTTESSEGLPIVRIRDVPNGKTNTFTPEEAPLSKRIDDGDVLIGMDGDFHMCFWGSGPAWLNQRVTAVRSEQEISGYFLRWALEGPISYYNNTLTGTTVRHLGARHLREIRLLIPPHNLLRDVNEHFGELGKQVIALNKMNERLAQARDLLLPRLMNGEIAV